MTIFFGIFIVHVFTMNSLRGENCFLIIPVNSSVHYRYYNRFPAYLERFGGHKTSLKHQIRYSIYGGMFLNA